jgi:selenocysteine-specific elongation factor
VIVATAGHVDHGKTLLVRTLTGVDTDRLPEEKARGLTIDLGFAYHDLGDGAVTGFVDVPGHERFVRTMVAGVSGIDAVLFVIAADDGPRPQTAEHLAILDLLGVRRGLVALTKIDRVSPARVDEVSAAIRALLAPTALAGCDIVPVSAVAGRGIEALRAGLRALAATVPARAPEGNFRLAVDRSFLLKGAGRVVTGTVFSGAIATGDMVWHVPGGGELRVRGIHAQNREAARAQAGERCALNLAGAGLRDGDIRRGDWMLAAAARFTSRRLAAEIRVLPGEASALANRTPVHVHVGAADVTGRVVTLDGQPIAPGASGAAHLVLDRELHAVRGDRVVLRDQSARRTVGGGVILDPLPEVRGRTRAERHACLAAMRHADVADALRAALEALPHGLPLGPFAQAWNLTPAALDALAARVPIASWGEPPRALPAARWEALGDAIETALAGWHAELPERPGASEAELAARMVPRLDPGLLAAVAAERVRAGRLARTGGMLHLPGHTPRRSAADEALWKRVEALLKRAGTKTPVVHDMLAPLGLELAVLDAFLTRASQQGRVVRVGPRRVFLPETMAHFEALVRELAASRPDGLFTAADFRDRAGIGRNAVIDILEHCDRVGLTRRRGEGRVLVASRRASGT